MEAKPDHSAVGAVGAPAQTKAALRKGEPAPIQDLFLARIDELERRVAEGLGRPAIAPGPVGQLALDLGREAWRAIGGLASGLGTRAKAVSMLASLAAADPVDVLGVDQGLKASLADALKPAARAWLGMHVVGGDVLASDEATLVLLNRSAWPLPSEALLALAFIAERAGHGRDVYALWDGDILETPWLGAALQRCGIFAATYENCRLLLSRGAIVVAFPEGAASRAKTYQDRYRLQRFDDACLLEAGVLTGARIVPGALVGGEESYPVVGRIGRVPITATFPWAGLLGLIPLPVAWKLELGALVEYPQGEGGDYATSASAVLADTLRMRMQAMLGDLVATRDSIISG